MVDPTGFAPVPCSLVWAPIPVISWLFPIGHLGVARSDGSILDFAVTMRDGGMAFGGPARFLPLSPELAVAVREQVNKSAGRLGAGGKSLSVCWDEWLAFSVEVFKRRDYSFLFENCHSFVAHFLNSVRYDNRREWTPVVLAWMMATRGRWVNPRGFLRTVIPSVLTLGLGWHYCGVLFLAVWCLAFLMIILWFSFLVHCASRQRNMLLSV